MIHIVITGILLGLASGLSPGPLQALVIAQSARFGWKKGALAALAPLITDALIVTATVWMFSHVPIVVLHVMTVIGSVMVAYIAFDTWKAARSHQQAPDTQTSTDSIPNRKALWQAAALNIMNPHAWLFWVVIGSPMVVRFANASLGEAAVFIVSFYACLVGIKVGIAISIDRSLSWSGGKGRIWLLRITALALAVLALVMAATGILQLVG